MGKRWICLLIVVSVVLLAFLFPRIMLLIMEKDIESSVLTYGTGTLLNFDTMTLGAKQALLSDPDVTVIREELSDHASENRKVAIDRELHSLSDYGALPLTVCDTLFRTLQNGDVTSCKAYDPKGKNVFYFYLLKSHDSYVSLDHDTGKILSIGAYIEEGIAGPFADGTWEVHLRSWAEYFGMSADNMTATSTDDRGATCKMTGNGNSSCYYSISLDTEGKYLECKSILLPTSVTHPQSDFIH